MLAIAPTARRSLRSRRVAAAAPARCGVILGIDPGLLRTGYALLSDSDSAGRTGLVEAGVIRLDRTAPLEQRLVELERSLLGLIESHRPATLACEQLYAHYRHPRTAILMGHARGVILATAARSGLEVFSIASTQVKKTLTGRGHSSKPQMQRAVAATLRLPVLPEPHDVADAIAIALCGASLRRAAAFRAGGPA